MDSELTMRIKQKSGSFSKGQRAIAEYIEEHSDKVAFMTASRLGAAVGVSESTVVRFAMEIGYPGYPEFQQAMQEMVRNKMTSTQRLEMTSANVEAEKLLDAVLDQDVDILKRTKESIDKEAFYRAADTIINAKKVYILGAGSSLALATLLFHYLGLMSDTVQLIETTGEADILQQTVHAGEGDALVVISFPRYSKRAVKMIEYANTQKVTAIALTDSPASPIARKADIVLCAKSDMVSFVDSLVGPMSVIDALIVTIAIKKKDQVIKTLQKLEAIWDEHGIYEKVDEKKN